MKDNNREQKIIARNNYRYPTINVSSDELNSDSIRHLAGVRDIASLIMLQAAVNAQLCTADAYADTENYELQEEAMNKLFVQISFGDYSASVDLRCEDTLCAFDDFISEAIYNLDAYRM